MSRNFAKELAAIQEQIEESTREVGRLQVRKQTLSSTRTEIVNACQRLGVSPTKEAIEAEIMTLEKQLATSISQLQEALKED